MLPRNTNLNRDIRLSKRMSYVLRHGAEKLNLSLNSSGYAKVSDLLAIREFREYNLSDVKRVVSMDSKQRYSLDEQGNEWMIRANQGHTISTVQDDDLLQEIFNADLCCHGTYTKNWKSIYETGLYRMKRNHIHFAIGDGIVGDVISGMRSDVEIKIYVDVAKAVKDGIKFYISKNNVILTPGAGERGVLLRKYFLKVIQVKDNQTLYENSQE